MTVSIHRTELIALVATMFASIAFSIDSMLPAMPAIGAEISPDDPNRAALILTSFVFGMGLGTFFTGPLSDAFGRKPVIMWGAAVYILAAGIAWLSNSLEMILAARLVQGIAAAAPRVVALAVLRDCFSGRAMAQVMSFVMMIFSIVPAVAPLLGSFIIDAFDWHAIFAAFMIFMAVIAIWIAIRLPETLPKENRRPLSPQALWGALLEMLRNPTVCISILAQTMGFGMLFAMITFVQPVFDQIFGRAESFPLWFGGIALVSASGSLFNALLVVRVGMRRLVTYAFLTQMLICAMVWTASQMGLSELVLFACFLFWQTSVFFMVALILGNLNAIAMEPMGHIAGMAASIMGGVATVLSAPFASLVGLSFNGTLPPLAFGVFLFATAGYGLMLLMARIERREAVQTS